MVTKAMVISPTALAGANDSPPQHTMCVPVSQLPDVRSNNMSDPFF